MKKKTPVIKSLNDSKSKLDFELEKLIKRKDKYKNPTRTFSIGQPVYQSGFCFNMVVKEKYEDLFYLVAFDSTDENYGKPITSRKESWMTWADLFASEGRKEHFNKRKENSQYYISFSNRVLTDLFSKYYYFGLNLNPKYQRELVWSLEDKEKLIDSIFNGIEIGKFAFIHLDFEENKPAYEVLDGKQRLTTIIDFFEDRFQYKGVFFSELSKEDKRYFENYSITVGETRNQLSEAEKMTYFLRLNVCGVPQSEEHIHQVEEMLNKELAKKSK